MAECPGAALAGGGCRPECGHRTWPEWCSACHPRPAAGGGDCGPAITPDALRREAQRRGDVYVHHATVRDLMRRLANHMEAMGEFAAGGGDPASEEARRRFLTEPVVRPAGGGDRG